MNNSPLTLLDAFATLALAAATVYLAIVTVKNAGKSPAGGAGEDVAGEGNSGKFYRSGRWWLPFSGTIVAFVGLVVFVYFNLHAVWQPPDTGGAEDTPVEEGARLEEVLVGASNSFPFRTGQPLDRYLALYVVEAGSRTEVSSGLIFEVGPVEIANSGANQWRVVRVTVRNQRGTFIIGGRHIGVGGDFVLSDNSEIGCRLRLDSFHSSELLEIGKVAFTLATEDLEERECNLLS